MLLNSGLDAACVASSAIAAGGAPESTNAYPYFCNFIQYASFGTGSATPAATDTSLGSQVGARSIDRGGFNNTNNYGLDGSAKRIWREQTFTRVFTIGSNVNATEWGLSPASSGNLSVRELFRTDPSDNSSSPITLTLETGDELQLVITLRVEADWQYQSASFVITGTAGNDTNGRHDGRATVTTGAVTTEAAVREALQAVWPGGGVSTRVSAAFMKDLSAIGLTDNNGVTQAERATGSIVQEAYTPGTYYRDYTTTWGTSDANGDIYAFGYGTYSYTSPLRHSGFQFILTDPVKLTKASTHRLVVVTRFSIARL